MRIFRITAQGCACNDYYLCRVVFLVWTSASALSLHQITFTDIYDDKEIIARCMSLSHVVWSLRLTGHVYVWPCTCTRCTPGQIYDFRAETELILYNEMCETVQLMDVREWVLDPSIAPLRTCCKPANTRISRKDSQTYLKPVTNKNRTEK